MKKLLILFGILDIIALLRGFKYFIPNLNYWNEPLYPKLLFIAMIITFFVLAILLFFSSYYLLKQNKRGLWLTYFQFPLRFMNNLFSFGFLFSLKHLFSELSKFHNTLFFTIVLLEIIRLLLTIIIHRKYFLSPKTTLT
jgi:hypothetical protein